ncbi:YjfB family protein [Campylobacter jejuni]|nr:putative motility protein [Campylobacter jejuni]EAM0216485.1 putative motility protein [Campylobacter jejuni]EDO8202677.1 putative motility protein [Campylobacter jejuni]EFP1008188.1 putative motility protein [Campylobacter jejuni]EJD3117111.1 YjfB family protein [Campylobacter jejuni]
MVSDVSMGNANLTTAVNTSVLKKSMDTNEALMNELIEGMEGVSQASAPQVSSSSGLDIYA